jgi:hypothetical protein
MAYHGPEIKLFSSKKEQETYENLAGAPSSLSTLLLGSDSPSKALKSVHSDPIKDLLTIPHCRNNYIEDVVFKET